MFTYQQNTHFSQAAACGRETFWGCIRNATTQWNIDSRRDILDVVKRHDAQGIARWLKQSDYQKFLYRKQSLKPRAREKFLAKSDEERLLAFASELKTNLPAFIFSCREFDATPSAKGTPFRHRRLKDCHLNGLVMLDIDHVENPLAVWEQLQTQQELMGRTKLVHITSSREGIRIVFTASLQAGNLADNQIAFARALGYQADGSCIDATRTSFAPKEEDILYIDETLFGYYDEEYDKKFTREYRTGNTKPTRSPGSPTPKPLQSGRGEADATPPEAAPASREGDGTGLSWRGYPVQDIIDARYAEKLPCAADSNRHNESLKLASDLLVLFDGDKQKTLQVLKAQPWVQEIIDERDEDVEQTVESAAQRMADREKKFLTQLPCKAMQEAIQKATGKTYKEVTESGQSLTDVLQARQSDMDSLLRYWGSQIAELSEAYPLLRDICKGLKPSQYPAAVYVAGSLLMTLMTRCTYRFYARPEERRRLNCSTLIIGDPASGKSFATRLYEQLASPIEEADKAGMEAINAYRELVKSLGANKDKPKKPKVVVRVHPARTSNAQFIQDMVNAKEVVDGEEMQLHLLTFDTELDNTLSVQRGGSWIDKQSLQLKAFHNEKDGQAYSNADSVLQQFRVVWNYIYTGTPIALRKMVNSSNFGSGLATRLSCIPLPSTNFEMMDREEHSDPDSDARLRLWAQKLDRMKGELPLQHIVDELYDWTERRMEDARENQSRADEMLLKRCAYHGLNFSAPFIVMRHWDAMHKEGDYWCGTFETDETDWRLAELLVNIQFACQRHFFGRMAEDYFEEQLKEASVNVRRSQKTIEAFRRLPEEFMVEDVMRCFQLAEQSARTRIMRLMRDHLAERKGDAKGEGCVKAVYRKTGVMM